MRPQTLGGGVYLVNVDLHAAGNSSGRPAAPSGASHGLDRQARDAGGAPVCRWLMCCPDRCAWSYGAAAALRAADALTLCSGVGGFLVSSSVVEDKRAAAGDAVADVRDVWGGDDTGWGELDPSMLSRPSSGPSNRIPSPRMTGTMRSSSSSSSPSLITCRSSVPPPGIATLIPFAATQAWRCWTAEPAPPGNAPAAIASSRPAGSSTRRHRRGRGTAWSTRSPRPCPGTPSAPIRRSVPWPR
jgi:hypothetical protein